MEPESDLPPVIAIVGETASGKSVLALDLARRLNGEIIAADSRTVYKGMDIGTAKPTALEQAQVPHHMLDIVMPDQQFSVAAFKELATHAITDIADRDHLPFIVGGTGLYVDALLYDFTFREPADAARRQELQALSVEELQERLIEQSVVLPENARNPRHLIRSLETGGATGHRHKLRSNTLLLGLTIERETLRSKIASRVDLMVERGFIEEVRRIAEKYGWSAPALQAPGYRAFKQYLEGTVTLDEAKAIFVQNDLRLAKRQRTWFKRNHDIHWLSNPKEAVDLITTFLNK